MKQPATWLFRALGPPNIIFVDDSCTQTCPAATSVDEEAIRTMANEWAVALSDGDMDALFALYDEDAVDIPPGLISIGRAAIRQRFESSLAEQSVNASISFDDVVVVGDWAFARGIFMGRYTASADGAQTQIRNDNLWIMRRGSDGSWRVAQMMYNSAGRDDQP